MSLVRNISVAKNVRNLLRSNGVRQRDLAAELGMHEQTVSNKLNGQRPFTLRDVARIADYFDVSVDYLLGRDSEEAAQ